MSKYLSFEERLQIAAMLKERKTFGEIGRQISKDRTTIAKEIKRYAVEKATGRPGYPFNPCKKRAFCKKKKICGSRCSHESAYKCSLCSVCNQHCPDFMEEVCSVKNRPPYVCNGCGTMSQCTLLKRIYDPEDAHIRASAAISESRTGILSDEDTIARINRLITPLVRNGQSLHQIYLDHADELMCSEKTLYNYVDACLFDIRNIDLPRKVKYQPRYKKPEFKVDRACRNGRTYQDFQKFIRQKPDVHVVQMDTVVGKIGGKCLLTIHFVDSSLMLAFLRDANTSRSVTDIFESLDLTLGSHLFEKLFPVILTDNGSEFSNPKAIEYRPEYRDSNTLLRTRIFYCAPGSPYQKGACEVNHELIRRVLPKGSGFDDLTQQDINRMMDHINSYKRKKLNDRTPYDSFSFLYGEDVLQKLGCSRIAAENIILKPRLLKGN